MDKKETELPATARRTLFFLLAIYSINFVDRQILSVLIEPIKADLGLTDTELGFLTGFAFAVFYATLGVPIGRLADRANRVSIISVAATIWSLMTAVSGLAQNFWQLGLARVGVGIGEAGCTPPAHSMIADLYPADKRAGAMAIYQLGIPIGSVAGLMLGGWVNEIWGWRIAFVVVGLPGLLLAAMLKLMVADPERTVAVHPEQDAGPTFRESLTRLWQIRSYRHILAGVSLAALSGYGVGTWFPAFLMRTYDIGSGEAGSWLGPLALVGGVAGTLIGGFATDHLGQRDQRWYVWFPGAAILMGLPVFAWICLTNEFAVVIGLLIFPNLFGAIHNGPSFAMVQSLSPVRMRSMASAIALLVINLIGLGLGPLVIGSLSEALEPNFGNRSLSYAMLAVIPLNCWAAIHFFLASRTLRAELGANS
ncbi:MFS transporter [Myxococcota bacterium]|nr:MFS transporter [Myxococcota bacterium]